jgi:4-hydroxythreonine-4-phosphate dehydrogenase
MTAFVVTMGDPAGIGPEVIAKAWGNRAAHKLPAFFAVGDIATFRAITDQPIAEITSPADAVAAFDTALPILHIESAGDSAPGHPTLDGAQCALHSLEAGVGLARSDSVAGLITAPISKHQLYQIGYTHPGQTEFIAERCGVSKTNAVMMLAGPDLRVVPITVHIPLTEVAPALSIDLIVARAHAAARGLTRNFGITRPRLAIAGLNPHAGEGGALGREEVEIIAPAVAQLQADGLDVSGPYSPDTMFTAAARASYDAALCMYHDQALIPFKAINFDAGVNMTLGLPIVRTSPDHGTAFDIAGRGIAESGPMIAAVHMAADAVRHRAAQDATFGK